jgi:hypothetical protein
MMKRYLIEYVKKNKLYQRKFTYLLPAWNFLVTRHELSQVAMMTDSLANKKWVATDKCPWKP